MLTKHQAEVIGEGLLEQARAQELERKNRTASRVSFFYRFPELNKFDPWQRPRIVDDAFKFAMRKPSVIAVWIASSIVAIAISFFFYHFRRSFGMPFILVSALIAIVPAFLYRRQVMRKYISALPNQAAGMQKTGDAF